MGIFDEKFFNKAQYFFWGNKSFFIEYKTKSYFYE